MQGSQNVGCFYCSARALNAMFESMSKTDGYNIDEKDVRKLSCKMIEYTLFLIKNIAFKVSKHNKVIESMEVGEMDSITKD